MGKRCQGELKKTGKKIKICHFINLSFLKSPESFRYKFGLFMMFILAYRKLKKLFCTEMYGKNGAHTMRACIHVKFQIHLASKP